MIMLIGWGIVQEVQKGHDQMEEKYNICYFKIAPIHFPIENNPHPP